MQEEKLEKETLGQRIKRLRKERGISQVDLAKSCGVTDPWISQVEQDKVTASASLLHNIASTFKIPLRELLQQNEESMELSSRIKLVEVLLEKRQPTEAEEIIHNLQQHLSLSDTERLQLTICLADSKYQQSKFTESLELLNPIISSLETKNHHDVKLLAHIRNIIGNNYFLLNDFSLALYNYRKAYDYINRFNSFDELAAKISYNVGYSLIRIGRASDAIDYLEKSSMFFLENKDLKRYAHTLFEQGISYKNSNNFDRALECFNQAKAIYKSLDLRHSSAIVQHTIASEITAKADQNKALKELDECLQDLEYEKDFARIVLINSKMANIHINMNHLDMANHRLQYASEIVDLYSLCNSPETAVFLRTKAQYYFISQKYHKSIEYSLKSADIFGTIGLLKDRIDSLQVAIDSYEKLGDSTETIALLKTCNSLWSQLHCER